MKNEKGITLLSLVITIIVLIILASIATDSGLNTIRYAKYNKAKSTMEIMQSNINKWNEEYTNIEVKNEEITEGKTKEQVKIEKQQAIIEKYGIATSDSSCDQTVLNSTISGANSSRLKIGKNDIADISEYRFLSIDYLKENLGIESDFEFLVNIKLREVILFGGIKYDNEYYFIPEDFELLNIENSIKVNSVTFNAIQEYMENNIIIYNINFKDNHEDNILVSKYNVEYKKTGETFWKDISNQIIKCNYEVETNGVITRYDAYKFPLTNTGTYSIRISTIDKEVSYEIDLVNFREYTVLAAIQEIDENNIILYGITFNNNDGYNGEGNYQGQTTNKNGEFVLDNNNRFIYEEEQEDGTIIQYTAYRIPLKQTDIYNFNINNKTVSGTFEKVPPRPYGYKRVANTNLDEGYVISDQINQNQESIGNEYVWIEVPQTVDVYKTTGLNVTNYTDSIYNSIETDLNEYSKDYKDSNSSDTYNSDITNLSQADYNNLKKKMLKSIYENGGFWIGRYEAGKENNNLVCKINAIPYNNIICSNAQELASTAITDNDFSSNLMFGVQWNLVIKYLEQNDIKNDSSGKTVEQIKSRFNGTSNDSLNWGNYQSSTFILNRGKYAVKNSENTWYDYTQGYSSLFAGGTLVEVANNISTKKGKNGSVTTVGLLTTAGASETNKKQNIYDLAGNLWEYTLENSTQTSLQHCTRRGGTFNTVLTNKDYVSSRSDTTKNDKDANTGFRVSIIYLK